METDELLKKRFRELARKCYQNNQYTFTGFLSLADLACFYEMEKELSYVSYKVWGGSEFCERAMVRFGKVEELGYEEEFPIACIKVKPLAAKFADALTHRDFLGALMNLGIERNTLGDIWLKENIGYIFCLEGMADFMIENLTKIKHTSVKGNRTKEMPGLPELDRQEVRIQISSERADGVLAKVYKLSRSEAVELFRQKKVFAGGRLCENNSQLLKKGDIISARGYGKFEYLGQQNISKKGKINASVMCYGKVIS
ncbi:YlmH/Sll1252 family protein [Parablautia muri]|nr:YlmH/Sll1252 family protein [Parablautia muri]